jgi:hypothetical protein
MVIIAIRAALILTSLPLLLGWLSRGKVVPTTDRTTLEDLGYCVDRWLELFPYNLKGSCFPRALSSTGLHGVPVSRYISIAALEKLALGWMVMPG